MLLTLFACLSTLLWAQDEALPDSIVETSQNSFEALLYEPSVDSFLLQYGDSLLIPEAGRSRILRDDYGIAHIYGETDTDVSFGFGYAQAQDHLIEMLLCYRMAKGQAAEILGPAYVDSDFKSLHWRIDHVAGELYGTIPERTRDLIGSFADGVNHYIDINRQTLPVWIRPIRGTDIVASSKWMALLFAEESGKSELASRGIKTTFSSQAGSNQVVVAPSRTLSSIGLAISDIHLPWNMPFKLYEAHLKSRTGLNVSGATFFGWPVILIGNNERLTWSFSSNDADIFDLYEEKLDDANSKRYLFEREKLRLSVRKEKIRVNSDVGVVAVARELQYSHHGPIYKVVDNWAYAAKTSVDDITDVIGQLYEMNRAQNLRSFRLALARLEMPVFNVTYADVDGNIYYAFLSRTPIRAEKFDWRAPIPGWTKETDWGGILPFSQLPQVINPSSGFLQNCNTPPDAVTTSSSLDRSTFPSYLGWGEMNDRGRRTLTWLAAHPAVSVEEARRLAKDEYLLAAEELKAIILRAYNRNWQELYDPQSDLALAISILRNWDNRASVNSRGIVLFASWKTRFDTLYRQLGEAQRQELYVLERLALEALQGATAYLSATFGRVDVVWGDVHKIKRGDSSFAVGGAPPGTEALHQVWSAIAEDGTYQVTGGSAYTSVVQLGSPPRSWSALPYGNSEDPMSPHFSDQALLQSGNKLKQTWIEDHDVIDRATTITTVPFEGEALEIERLRAWWQYQNRLVPVEAPTDATITETPGPEQNQ